MEKTYTAGQLAKIAHITPRTLRWYDTKGLLSPMRGENGYRYYTETQADELQRILFYRELGLGLDQICELQTRKLPPLAVLCEQYEAVQEQKRKLDSIEETLLRTIRCYEKGEAMSEIEKFECFKKDLIQKNEETYGSEVRQKYGDEAADKANRQMRNLTKEQYQRMIETEQKMLALIQNAAAQGVNPTDTESMEIAELHKAWLSVSLPNLNKTIWRGIVDMYICDERFTAYYDDKAGEGTAQFLRDAVYAYTENKDESLHE